MSCNLVMKTWEVAIGETKIRVTNELFRERLFVDDQLQDEFVGIRFSAYLTGSMRRSTKEHRQIKVSLGGMWGMHCRIFVDDTLVFHSDADWETRQMIVDNLKGFSGQST